MPALVSIYTNASIQELEKEALRMRKQIARLLKTGEGEMGYNGHRSTRKATANHGAWMLSNQLSELEAHITERKRAELLSNA